MSREGAAPLEPFDVYLWASLGLLLAFGAAVLGDVPAPGEVVAPSPLPEPMGWAWILLLLIAPVPLVVLVLRSAFPPRVPHVQRPALFDILTVLLLYMATQVGGAVVVKAMSGSLEGVALLEAAALGAVLAILALLGLAFRRGGRAWVLVSLRARGASLGSVRRAVGASLLLYLVCLPVVYGLAELVARVAGDLGFAAPGQGVADLVQEIAATGPWGFGVTVLYVCLLAPLVEELCVRVFLQGALRRVLPAGFAITLAAAAFTLAHVEPSGPSPILLVIFALGLLLGWVYERTGDLRACVLVHVLHNAITLCQVLLAD